MIIYQEIKRRLLTKTTVLSVMGLFIITIVLNATIFIYYDNIDIHDELKEEAIYSGEITEDKLWLCLQKVRDDKSNEKKYQSLVSFIHGLTISYPGILYTENKIEDFPDTYAKDFYNCWKQKSIAIINKLPKSKQIIAKQQLDKINIPFIRYPGSYIWQLGFENLQILYTIIIFIVTFFAASTYSESFEDGSIDILSATKSYKKMMFIRFIPVIIYGLILTIISTLGTALIIIKATGLQSLDSSFQTIVLFTVGNFTIKHVIVLISISTFLGIIAHTTLMGYISYKTKKTNLSIAIGVAINIFYIILAYFINIPNKFINKILNMIPMAASQIIYDIPGFRYNNTIWTPYSIMLNMIIIFLIFTLLFYCILKKAK